MKTEIYKSEVFLLTVLFSLLSISSWATDQNSEKKREITRSFKVEKNDIIHVENTYGNITVTHWNKNEVEIHVVIEAKARTDSQVKSMIDLVVIDINQSGNKVKAVTSVKSVRQTNNNENNRLTINYDIKMPSGLAIDFEQKYGNIHLPDKNEGTGKIKLSYGNLYSGSFSKDVKVDAKYSNVEFGDVVNLNLEVAYCGKVALKSISEGKINSKYSQISAGKIKNIKMNMSYGSLKADELEAGQLGLKYSNVNLKRLKKELNITELSYGNLDIKEVDSSFERIYISARYGNATLALSKKTAFSVDATGMRYGNIKMKDFKITDSDIDSKSYYRYKVNGGGKASIEFSGNNYSNITLKSL